MALNLSQLPVKDGFRLRGEAVSRLENFVDGSFAFAVTMMVVSVGELPHSVAELLGALRRTPAFVCCFVILLVFWAAHNRWSRRYGLDTRTTTALSMSLVLVMLTWIFPLRIVMSAAFSYFTDGWLPADAQMNEPGALQDCFVIYGLG